MKRVTWRPVAAIIILTATTAAFLYYFATHPVVRHQLQQTKPLTIAIILLLYFGTVGSLSMINIGTLKLCRIRMPGAESLLLSSYSSVINFFGPLQSGPAFRAVYLKKKYGLKLRNYTTATFMYYFFYGAFSGMFLLSGLLKWWLLALAVTGLAVALLARRSRWAAPRLAALNLGAWYYLALATFLQVSLVAFIYYAELRTVAPGTHFSQAIVYTGAANLALFVSLTPGAIGFRESFLLFSERLHHISPAAIVSANIIDRAMYITLLLIMALFIFGTHARRSLLKPTET